MFISHLVALKMGPPFVLPPCLIPIPMPYRQAPNCPSRALRLNKWTSFTIRNSVLQERCTASKLLGSTRPRTTCACGGWANGHSQSCLHRENHVASCLLVQYRFCLLQLTQGDVPLGRVHEQIWNKIKPASQSPRKASGKGCRFQKTFRHVRNSQMHRQVVFLLRHSILIRKFLFQS